MPNNTPPDWASSKLDTTVPHSARIWNYWLGGKDNYPADRQAATRTPRSSPASPTSPARRRYFLARVVRYLAADAGIRQFLDIGTGLPTVDNTHEVAQAAAPRARIVHVDNDPIVLSHARALLTSSPQGACDYIDADLREPAKILHAAAATLDFTQPIALMLMGIIGHIADPDAHPIAREMVDALPAGSYLAMYDGSNVSEAFNTAQDGYNQTGADPYHLRSPAQIARFFHGLDLVEPGVVPCSGWRPDLGPIGPPAADSETYGAVGRIRPTPPPSLHGNR